MKLVHVGSACVLLAALTITGIAGAGEQADTDVATTSPVAPVKVVPEKELKIVEGLKELEKDGHLQKLVTPLDKLDLPSDLTGQSKEEIMKYTKLLFKRERKLQRRITYHLAFSAFTAFLTYLLHSNAIFFPLIGFLDRQNQNFRGTLDADWMIFQEQLASFLCEYMRVKHIDPKTLPVSRVTGLPLINLEYEPEKFIYFPVWRTQKDQPLPLEAGLRQTGPMLKNWWSK